MWMFLAALTQPPTEVWPSATGTGLRGLMAVFIVLCLVCVFVWLLRRGVFRLGGRTKAGGLAVEAAVPLGDRRSLVIVTVEGRRLLLGLTPVQISLVAELQSADRRFGEVLARELGGQPGGAE